jgi:hypothetical protein
MMRRALLYLQDALFPLFVAASALYYIGSTWTFPWKVQIYGLCVAGLALLLSAILAVTARPREANSAPPFRWVLVVVGLSGLFVLALPFVGYVLCVIALTTIACMLWSVFGFGGTRSETPWRDTAKGLALGCFFAFFAYGMVLTSRASLPAFPWS